MSDTPDVPRREEAAAAEEHARRIDELLAALRKARSKREVRAIGAQLVEHATMLRSLHDAS
jgi:chaperonin GroEL (HSP60 family)